MPSDDSAKMFADLRPSALDDVTAQAYDQRRAQDLARITGTPRRSPAPSRRGLTRWRLALPITAVAAAGAVAIGVVATSGSTPGTFNGPTAHGVKLDAQTVLLATADAAAKTPLRSGSYWYTAERDVVLVTSLGGKAYKSASKRPVRKASPPPFTAWVAATEQSWSPTGKGTTRTVTGIDHQNIFASAAGRATWVKIGSPDLNTGYPLKPTTSDDNFGQMTVAIGNHTLTLAQLKALPATTAGLAARLRALYATDAKADPSGGPAVKSADSFTAYVFENAQDLLVEPITPATRAALYRVLAEQPGITARKTTDPEGRSGVALSMADEGSRMTLIVNPSTSELLAYEAGAPGANPNLTETYLAVGWTNQLGRPVKS